MQSLPPGTVGGVADVNLGRGQFRCLVETIVHTGHEGLNRFGGHEIDGASAPTGAAESPAEEAGLIRGDVAESIQLSAAVFKKLS